IINSYVVDFLFKQPATLSEPEKGTMVAGFSAMIGAVILGAPIVWTSFKDIRQGILSINELVGIAVLAAFASGDYKTAGLVAFFMLMGEIIETRTAAGARASIESLIKLTPTKARRILAAEKTRLPIMRIVDQYMVYYTPLVLVIGALVWAFTRNLNNVISVLVVACPCAFILATPTAMVAALSAAARLGILIKNVGDI